MTCTVYAYAWLRSFSNNLSSHGSSRFALIDAAYIHLSEEAAAISVPGYHEINLVTRNSSQHLFKTDL